MTRWTPQFLAAVAVALLGAGPLGVARADDDLAPVIEHARTEWAPVGKPLKLRAKVMSMSGAEVKAEVHVRPVGLQSFSPIALKPITGLTQVLQAEIPAELVEGEFDYYVEAYDLEGNGPGLVGSAKAPLHVRTYTGNAPPPASAAVPEEFPPVPPEALSTTPPEPAGPSLFERTPVWVWGLVGGAALAAGGAVALKLSSDAIADENTTTVVDGVTHNSVTQADAQWANTAATSSAVLGGVAVGLAGAGVAGLLVEW